MSSRVTVSTEVSSVPAPATDVATGHLFIAGAAASTVPQTVVRVTSVAGFVQDFGARVTANEKLFDAVSSFFAEGGAVAYVRAGTPPTDWATFLDDFVADLGPGVVAIAGAGAAAAVAVGAHVTKYQHRTGLMCGPVGQSAPSAITAAGVAGDVTGAEKIVYVWPAISFNSNVIEPLGFAAAKRAVAHASSNGPAQSPLNVEIGSASVVDGVESSLTDAQFTALNDAHISVIKIVDSRVRIYGWNTLASMPGDSTGNLAHGQYVDLLASIAWGCAQIGENWVGRLIDGKGVALGGFAGDLTGLLAKTPGLYARVGVNGDVLDPGYRVNVGADLNTPTTLAAGLLNAVVGVRLSPSAEFVDITVSAVDAAGNL